MICYFYNGLTVMRNLKRYDKYERNIARLILARKEVLEENLKYMDITKQELMLIWS